VHQEQDLIRSKKTPEKCIPYGHFTPTATPT